MDELEQLMAMFVAAVLLAAAARRVGAPYPVFLALGGAVLTLIPGAPSLVVPPDLVLALFVAPVLLDAAYDASLRDLRDNWAPVASLVVFAVVLTTLAVAAVARIFVPQLPWAAAIALGAIVAPPDAVAATAVLRQVRPPQRIVTILEGESMLNDASALLIYRGAVAAVAAGSFSVTSVAPAFLFSVIGSVVAGIAFGWVTLRALHRMEHVPSAIIMQFVLTFSLWLFAEQIGLSGVLTTVCFAWTLAQGAPARTPARIRLATNAVWDTVVFALNILAFIFVGLQLGPIMEHVPGEDRATYFAAAAAILGTVIAVRLGWHMSVNAVIRWRDRRFGFRPPRPMLQSSVGSGLVISWAGMRGIVTLAAAMALPERFPYRDFIMLTAFCVVLGTLAIHGLTLKPLLRILALHDEDPVGREVKAARERALQAAFATLDGLPASTADFVRRELRAGFASDEDVSIERRAAHGRAHDKALKAARQAALDMRDNDEIGDDAFHRIERDLDRLEMAQWGEGGGGA